MLSTIAALALAASNPTAPETKISSKTKIPYRVCRMMIAGASRSGDVKVCRTKEEWRRWEACNSPTSYCSAEQKAERYGRATPFALSEDSRVICRVLKATGSRIQSQRLCLPQREWQRQWDEASAAAAKMQDRSMRPRDVQ